MREEQIPRWKHGLILAAVILLLTFSWLVLFGWIDEFGIYLLVPYDDVWSEGRPFPGTWQRQLNDFFERPPWRHLPACLIVGASTVLLMIALGRTSKSPLGIIQRSIRLGLSFALSNFVLVAAMMSIGYVNPSPNELKQALALQYGRYGPAFLLMFMDILFALVPWLALQAWGIPKWVLARSPREAVSQ